MRRKASSFNTQTSGKLQGASVRARISRLRLPGIVVAGGRHLEPPHVGCYDLVRMTALFALALLATSCSSSSPPTPNEKVRTFAQAGGGAGFGGQTLVDSYATNATVVSIDSADRKLELKLADGK